MSEQHGPADGLADRQEQVPARRPRHPAVLEHERRRAEDVQLRLADAITRFAGSMPFVWVHAALFTGWMLWFERPPWPALTLVVSLEAIFLSTFVLIGQNRQAEFARTKADHDFRVQQQELRVNTELTRALYQHLGPADGSQDSSRPGPPTPGGPRGSEDLQTVRPPTEGPRTATSAPTASAGRLDRGAAERGADGPPPPGGPS